MIHSFGRFLFLTVKSADVKSPNIKEYIDKPA